MTARGGAGGSGRPARLALLLAGAVLPLGLGACSSGGADEPDADVPLAEMETALAEVLSAAAPGADQAADRSEIPCGGLGGNEWNKVKATLDLSAASPLDVDPKETRAAARNRALELGYEAVVSMEKLSITGERFYAELDSRQRRVTVSGQTSCLDNPGR